MKTNTLDFDAQALRERILDLAMRGKLVPQDPNDEPASVLLEKIKAEKEELVKEKKIKKREANLPKFDNLSYLPTGWVMTKLKEITTPLSLNDGDWILSKNMSDKPEVKLIQLGSIGYGKYVNKGFKYITNDTFDELNCTQIKPGYLLINRLINKNKLMTTILPDIDGKLITAVDICWIAPSKEFNQEFMMYQLMSPKFQRRVNKLASGSTRKRISKGNLINIPIYLPPLSEQSRIAAKIAQLFALLRKVESSTQQYAELQTLLKSKVLDLAMRGKLVKQDPNDEPASVLLEKIKAEKAELVKEKKIKKSKPLSPITDEEKPFDIPDSWEWVRLGAIFDITSSKRVMKSEWRNEGVPFYRAREIVSIKNHRALKDPIFISEETYKEKAEVSGRPKIDDILLTGVGTLGVPYVVSDNKEFYFKDGNIIWLRNIGKINSYYISNYVQSPYMTKIINNGRGTTVATLTIVRARNLLVPLPPLMEQTRIVNKINKLYKLI